MRTSCLSLHFNLMFHLVLELSMSGSQVYLNFGFRLLKYSLFIDSTIEEAIGNMNATHRALFERASIVEWTLTWVNCRCSLILIRDETISFCKYW